MNLSEVVKETRDQITFAIALVEPKHLPGVLLMADALERAMKAIIHEAAYHCQLCDPKSDYNAIYSSLTYDLDGVAFHARIDGKATTGDGDWKCAKPDLALLIREWNGTASQESKSK